MLIRHYLVRWKPSQQPRPGIAELEATVRQVAQVIFEAVTAEDLSPVMREPALAISVIATQEEHVQACELWNEHQLVVEDLDQEVRALSDPDQK